MEEEGRSRRWEEGNRWWRRKNRVGERGVARLDFYEVGRDCLRLEV